MGPGLPASPGAIKSRLRFTLSEFSGGLGDLGTFIPLTAGVALISGLNLTTILIWSGVFSIVAGLSFRQPIPIQPMKSIAVVAIAERLAPGEIVGAGLVVGIIILLVGVSGLSERFERLIPRSIVRGIQLGVGLKLGVSGLNYISATQFVALDSVLTAILLGGFTFAFTGAKRFPSALFILVCGIGIAIATAPAGTDFFQPGLPELSFSLPQRSDWIAGILDGALPQLPLTLLNSVIAICALSGDLFPGRGVSPKNVSLSIGLMNLVAVPLGGMPMCHGSGGLAAHYYFGARTGGSVIMFGATKILLALLFGVGLIHLLQLFPVSVLGVMLVFAGIELAKPARDQHSVAGFTVMVLTAIGIVALNTGAGFLVGALVAILMRRFPPRREDQGKESDQKVR